MQATELGKPISLLLFPPGACSRPPNPLFALGWAGFVRDEVAAPLLLFEALKIVTSKQESMELEQQLESLNWALHDVVLDDGTWLPDTMAVGDQAFALLIRGHTAFQFFRDVPHLAGRTITHTLRVRRRQGSLLVGWGPVENGQKR